MSMLPRVGVLSLMLLTALSVPNAAASSCIDIQYTNFGSGLHVIANTGREIALGLVTGSPGEGVGATAIITPSICMGGNILPSLNGTGDVPLPTDQTGVAPDAIPLPLLP